MNIIMLIGFLVKKKQNLLMGMCLHYIIIIITRSTLEA
jgi:hypothetical protein